MKLSLIKKLSFFTIGFIILISLVTSFGLYHITSSEIENLEKKHLRDIVVEINNDLDDYFQNRIWDLNSLLEHGEVFAYLKSSNRSLQDQNLLGAFYHHNYNEIYSAIYLMDSGGKVLVSTDPTFVEKNYSFRPYFQDAIEHGQSHDISIGVTSNKLGYYFAKKIIDENGEVLGVLVMKLKPEAVQDAIYLDSLGENSNLMLVDKYGVIIHSYDHDKLYKSLAPLDYQTKKIIESQNRFPGIEIEGLNYNLVFDFINSKLSTEIFESINPINGEEEILAAAKTSKYQYMVVLEENKESFLSIASSASQKLSLVVLLVAFFMSLIVYYFIHKLLIPLTSLRDGIYRIEHGDLSHRVSIKTLDELQDIGEGFNRMAAKLEKNIKKIEGQILERTKTLEQLNKHMVGRELKMMEMKRTIQKKENSKHKKHSNED